MYPVMTECFAVSAPVFGRIYFRNQSIGDLTSCFCLSANLSEKQVFLSSKPLYYPLIGNLCRAETIICYGKSQERKMPSISDGQLWISSLNYK